MQTVSFRIHPQRHRQRCRAALELLATPGPQLPLERRRVDPRTGAMTVRTSAGAWIGID